MTEKKRLQDAYKTVMTDHFPSELLITLGGKVWDGKQMVDASPQTLFYDKVTWKVPNEKGELEDAGLRYGENPGQEAALFKLINGNLTIGDVKTLQSGKYLASNVELLQSGKHPGKTNITDSDNALNILRFFSDEAVVAILKHNNPCGVAIGDSIFEAYIKANLADRVAAFGGTIGLNRSVDKATAKAIIENYSEVVVAPEFDPGVMEIFEKKKNLRVMKIENMHNLKNWVGQRVIDFKSLIDGGLILQTSYVPDAITIEDIKTLPLGYHKLKKSGEEFNIETKPTEQQYRDMWFGWLVESGITSNSVIYVKDGVTVGIGTGEQDRVGVAKIARDKAYEKLKDKICYEKYGVSYNDMLEKIDKKDTEALNKVMDIDDRVEELCGGLKGAVAVSDAFFPERDGVDVILREGVNAIIQPGGSEKDYKSINACNDAGATMVYTAQRSFKH